MKMRFKFFNEKCATPVPSSKHCFSSASRNDNAGNFSVLPISTLIFLKDEKSVISNLKI